MSTILIVSAHPDDEVLGCGGTIARLAEEGHKVHICILGEGMTSRYKTREEVPAAELEKLHGNAKRAAEILGAATVTFHGLPDNRFDTVPLLEIVKVIEDKVNELKPEEVYTQHGGDLNIDHVLTFRAVLTATRPMQGTSVKKVYGYEVMSSTEWTFQKFAPAFEPNTFTDISATLEKKIAAMQAYETELRPFPHPRSPEALRAYAVRWGSVAGMQAAEAFQLIRALR